MDETAIVMKRGELCIQARLQRNTSGLSITVKAHARVEEFFRTLSGGHVEDARKYGRYWTPVEKEKPLYVYDAPGMGAVMLGNGYSFRLDRPGHPIMEALGDHNPLVAGNVWGNINISFLRLVGLSEGDGVTFKVNGVHTLDAIRSMRDRIGEAGQSFYVNYLRPIDLDVQISTQDIPR